MSKQVSNFNIFFILTRLWLVSNIYRNADAHYIIMMTLKKDSLNHNHRMM